MEKKFKFSDNPTVAKTVYGAIIAILCITAIVVGIVAANNRKGDPVTDDNPPASDEGGNTVNPPVENPDDKPGDETKPPEEKLSFIAPVTGKVMKSHSTSVPAYSTTLEAWKIHTGIDIMTDEEAEVFAVEAGEVTGVYAHPMLGNTVEITHTNGTVSRYSNLSSSNLPLIGTEVEKGAKIGCVGDSAISELADETHLHFEMLVNNTSVNPLDYISDDAKKVSLGITEEEAA